MTRNQLERVVYIRPMGCIRVLDQALVIGNDEVPEPFNSDYLFRCYAANLVPNHTVKEACGQIR